MKGQLSRTIVSSVVINFRNYAKPLSKHQLEEVRKKEDQSPEH